MVLLLKEIIKNKKGKLFLPFFILGCGGLTLEVTFRAITGSMIDNYNYFSLMGFSSIWMILVYGTGGLILSIINEIPNIYNLKMIYQAIIGGLSIIIIEFLFGIFFNIFPFNLNLWYYEYFHILNQICLSHSLLWILCTPLFIYLCDFVGWALYRENEEWHYKVWDNYIDLIKFQ